MHQALILAAIRLKNACGQLRNRMLTFQFFLSSKSVFPLESDRIYLAVVVKLKRQDNTQKNGQKAKTWHFAQNYHFTTSSQFLKFHKCHCCFRNAWRLRTHRGKSVLGRAVLESWRAPNLLGIPCETDSRRLVSEGNCGDGVQQRC